jgi:hypothetical protein
MGGDQASFVADLDARQVSVDVDEPSDQRRVNVGVPPLAGE